MQGSSMLPIKSALKSNHFKWGEPIDVKSWSWLKLLRENNKTKRMYPVDPYAEVYQFRDNMYGVFTDSIGGGGDAWTYIINGPEKAMIIDTSMGLGNLKGLCDEITGGKPIICVNTHWHLDHALGNYQFDKVYIHEYDADLLRASIKPDCWDSFFDENGNGIYADFDRNDLVPFKEYEVIGVPDGYTFDLGKGYEIELIHLAGHSSGQAGFLDKTGRTFFPGDDILSMRIGISGARPGTPYAEYSTIPAYYEQLKKLEKRMDEFDFIFPGHFIGNLENVVIPALIEACELIIEDPEKNCSYKETNSLGNVGMYRFVKGLGVICYSMDSAKKL